MAIPFELPIVELLLGPFGEGSFTFRDSASSEHLFHHVTANISQAEIASLEFVRQAQMINAEAMQDGGLQVVDMDGIFENVIGVVVSLADAQAFLDPAAGHPNGEAAGVMVAAIIRGAQ